MDRRSALRLFAGLELAIAVFGASAPRSTTTGSIPWASYPEPFAGGCPPAPGRAAPAHRAHGYVPALPRARLRRACCERRANHRPPLRREHVRGRARRPRRSLLAHLALRVAGGGLRRSRRERGRRPRRSCHGAPGAGSPRRRRGLAPRSVTTSPEPSRTARSSLGCLYALSGFVALSLEILWFRLMDVAVKSTAFTFGTVLAVYLAGNGVGSLLGAFRFTASPGRWPRFSGASAGSCLLAGLPVLLLVALLPPPPGFATSLPTGRSTTAFCSAASSMPARLPPSIWPFPRLSSCCPPCSWACPFPSSSAPCRTTRAPAGARSAPSRRRTSWAAWLGSLLVGLASLGTLGTAGTLRLLVALGLVFAALGAWRCGPRIRLRRRMLVGLVLSCPARTACGVASTACRRPRRPSSTKTPPASWRWAASLPRACGSRSTARATAGSRSEESTPSSGPCPRSSTRRPAGGPHRSRLGRHRLGRGLSPRDGAAHRLRDIVAAAAHPRGGSRG